MTTRRSQRCASSHFMPPSLVLYYGWIFLILLRCGSFRNMQAQAAAAAPFGIPLLSDSSVTAASSSRTPRRLRQDRCHDHQGRNRNQRMESSSSYNRQRSSYLLGKRTRVAWILPPSVTVGDPSSVIVGGSTTTSSLLSSPVSLWFLRGASALLTYAGCVAYWDRPRGGENIALPPSGPFSTTTLPPNTCLQIAPSSVTGAGLGLFVTQRLDRGTQLGYYPGVVLPLAPHVQKLQTAPACEAYIWRFSDQQMVIDPTNEMGELEVTCRGGNPQTFGSSLLFAAFLAMWQVPTTLCRINEPPLGRDVNVITVEDVETRQVALVLERDVYPGEELFMDYGRDYDRSGYARVERRDAVDLSSSSSTMAP